MKVRVVEDERCHQEDWAGQQRDWLLAHGGKVVEGCMVGDDLFEPDDAPFLHLYATEYEVVEEATEADQRRRAGILLRRHGDSIPASLRSPLMAVRDSTEVAGTLEGVMEIVNQWLQDKE